MPPPAARTRRVRFLAFESVRDVEPIEHECELGDLLSWHHVARKEQAPLFSFARYRNGEFSREDASVERVDHLVYDLDRAHPPIDDFALAELRGRLSGRAGAIYSTHRHLEDHPRYRLVLLLAGPVPAAGYREAWYRVSRQYDLPLGDAKSQNESRMFYAPSCPPERKSRAVLEWLEGEPLNVLSRAPESPATPMTVASAVSGARQPIARAPRPGQRNEELFRFACSLRRRGFSQAELEAVVGERNQRTPRPLDEDEVRALCQSATRYDPEPALMEAQRAAEERVDMPPLGVGDHVEVARIELAALGWREGLADPLVVGDQGGLLTYRPELGTWSRLEDELLRARVCAHSGQDVQRPGLKADGEPFAPSQLKVTHQFARGTAATMVDLATVPGWLDRGPPGIAFSSGFVQVERGRWQEWDHRPEHRCRHRLPHAFSDDPKTPGWDEFLRDLKLPVSVIGYLHEYLGACLVGDVTRYKTCLVIQGSGDNGKSVLLDVLQACFPEGSVAALRPSDWGRRFNLSALVGRLINVVDEMPSARIQDADVFKAVVSGGRVRAEKKYEPGFEIRPRCGHVFAANELPRSLDRTDGFFTRWAVIKLDRQFAKDEQDPRLRDRLLLEVPAIASRFVLAAAELSGRGRLDLPEPVEAARAEWRAQSDHALRFAMELRPDPSSASETRELYQHFVRWCEHDERVPRDEIPSLKAFGRAMARAGHEKAPDQSGRAAWRVRHSAFGGLQ